MWDSGRARPITCCSRRVAKLPSLRAAKLGQLLDHGVWQATQLVDSAWIRVANVKDPFLLVQGQ